MTVNVTPLLNVYLYKSTEIMNQVFVDLIKRLQAKHITVHIYRPDQPLPPIPPHQPRVYVSLGGEWNDFSELCALPVHEKNRWLHYASPEECGPQALFHCWLHATDPLPARRALPSTRFTSNTPLVSIFTASYRSQDKIQRPYQSLLRQTYTNWEWVIIDDSNDDDATYREHLLKLCDPRVRRYRQDGQNGYIGALKKYAAGLCSGEILVELDHDDELTPDCLQRIVEAFQAHPECGFVFGDCTEVHEGTLNAHWYGWDCGYGYSIYYRVWVEAMNRWQNVHQNTAINRNTLRHLVGLPNHPRAWTRACYQWIGGHREELMVADDYDLLIRTFLSTTYVLIPNLVYIQYRNEHGNNTTFTRNAQIQLLVQELHTFYEHRIREKLDERNMPALQPYQRIWLTSKDDPARRTTHVIQQDSSRVSLLFPIPHRAAKRQYQKLIAALQEGESSHFKDIEIVVVGRIPTTVYAYASRAPMGAIRWWSMEREDCFETCLQYAELIASCREKVVVEL